MGRLDDVWTVQISKGDNIIGKFASHDATLYEFFENTSNLAILISNTIANPKVKYNKILNTMGRLIKNIHEEREIKRLISERAEYSDTIQAEKHTEMIKAVYEQRIIRKIEEYMKDLDENEILAFEKRIDNFLK